MSVFWSVQPISAKQSAVTGLLLVKLIAAPVNVRKGHIKTRTQIPAGIARKTSSVLRELLLALPALWELLLTRLRRCVVSVCFEMMKNVEM